MTPTVPDGPDTELAAAIGFLARNEGLLIEMEHSPAGRAAATIVRAVLARPAAGRDLTDVEDEILATLNSELKVPPRAAARIAQARADQAEGYGSTTSTVEGLLRELDRRAAELLRLRTALARPAVARTDGQTPAVQGYQLDEIRRLQAAGDALADAVDSPDVAIYTRFVEAWRSVRASAVSEPQGFDVGARVWSGASGRHGTVTPGDNTMSRVDGRIWVRFDGDDADTSVKTDILHPVSPKPQAAEPPRFVGR